MLYPPVADLLKDVESRYLLVNVVAQRARQIAAEAEAFQEELTDKAHNYELAECGSTVLCLDGYMAGIGSNSCGPILSEKYQVCDEELTFTMDLNFEA